MHLQFSGDNVNSYAQVYFEPIAKFIWNAASLAAK